MRKSHGALVGYKLSQSSAEEDGWTTVSLPPESFNYPIILNNSSDITVAVAAQNPAGLSQPSTVTTPAYRAGRGSMGHFLSYQTAKVFCASYLGLPYHLYSAFQEPKDAIHNVDK